MGGVGIVLSDLVMPRGFAVKFCCALVMGGRGSVVARWSLRGGHDCSLGFA
jgi:hypothetical protein